MTQERARRLGRSVVQAVLGGGAVAALTVVCERLGLDVATTAMVDLIAIVLLSLIGNLAVSAVVAVVATLCLHLLFIQPRYTWGISDPLDVVALGAFLLTALVITRLLSRVRRSLDEAEAARQELRLALDTIPALVWTTLPDGRSELSNARWLELTGLSSEEARDWGYRSALHPEDYERLAPKWSASFQSGTPIEDEARLRQADGQYRWFLHRAVPLRDERGTVVKWYGTSFDIEERKRTKELLRERARLLDLTHDSVFVRDLSDVITYWNRGAEELYGWSEEEALGSVTHQLLETVFPVPFEEIKAVLVRTGRWEGELLHTTRGRSQLVVSSRWSLQRDDRGQPVGILETNTDITARKRAEQALRRTRERALKARFAAVLDERTRLAREIHDTLLQGFTGVALKLVAAMSRVSGPPEATAALRDVVSLAQKTLVDARRAVWDLRTPSSGGEGVLAALRTAAEDCVRATGLTLEFEVEGPPRPLDPEIEGATVRVVQEAVTNVVKHAAASTVRIRVAFAPKGVRVSVTDDGRGFDVEPNLHAFGGHWGLLGMQERATQVRGKLRVRSAAGRGTEVVFLAPYVTRAGASPAPTP